MQEKMILKPCFWAAPWWERHPGRAEREKSLMYQDTNAVMEIIDGQMVWNETIYNDFGTLFEASYVAQGSHPFDPPRAYITYPEITPSMDYHMFGDGHLCLARDQDMDSSTTIYDIRGWTCLWVTCYETYINTGKWIALEH